VSSSRRSGPPASPRPQPRAPAGARRSGPKRASSRRGEPAADPLHRRLHEIVGHRAQRRQHGYPAPPEVVLGGGDAQRASRQAEQRPW
jgi:hypothetical protein